MKGAQKWKRCGRLARELACLPTCLPACLPADADDRVRRRRHGWPPVASLYRFSPRLSFSSREVLVPHLRPPLPSMPLGIAPLENFTAPPRCNPSYSLRRAEVVDSAFSSQVHVYGVSSKYERNNIIIYFEYLAWHYIDSYCIHHILNTHN